LLAAVAAGVTDAARASLDSSSLGVDRTARVNYKHSRMMVHELRHAVEREAVVKALDARGTRSVMTHTMVERQRGIGALGFEPGDGLAAKIDAILGHQRREAA
jgi:hypothetical protein